MASPSRLPDCANGSLDGAAPPAFWRCGHCFSIRIGDMKRSGARLATGVLITAFGLHGSAFGTEMKSATAPRTVLEALAGGALSARELAGEHARGLVIGSAISEGTVTGNAVVGTSVTGAITNTNSINNNVGITTVFQNTGNNSLFQQSTSIFITMH
jgi:hypothetical protein